MTPRETEDNAYANLRSDQQTVLWYVMVFSGVVNLWSYGSIVSFLSQESLRFKECQFSKGLVVCPAKVLEAFRA